MKKSKHRAKSEKPKIRLVKLAPKEALHVVVPKTVTPLVIPHPERGIVAIVPVPKVVKRRTFLQWMSRE